MQVDTIINARWIIPVEPDEVILEHHALVIHEGNILDILPQQQAQQKYQALQTETLDTHALIPGFINAHTHVAMSLFRGIADDLPLMNWLEKHIWPLEKKWANAEFVRDGTDLAIAEMLRGGTTCFNDMYFFPEVTAHQAIQHGVRANIGLIMIDFPTAWADGPEQYIEKGLALHDELRHEPLIRTPFAPHAPYTVSDEPLRQISTLAAELNLPIHMHVHETLHEVSQGPRPLKRLHDLGLINPAFIAVHMTQLSTGEINKFAQSGAHIVHCPESNLKLASGFCPVQKCLDAGINVALGTDGAASNNDLDMLGEMRTAALLAKGVAQDASAVNAATALRMATLNGAKALGIDDITGSLMIGKAADICAIDLSDIETQPLYNATTQIVYSATRNQVSDVWVAGKRCLKNRQLTTLNLADLKSKIAKWQLKLSAPLE
ncbi:N-ethylammeline chlorohydrolase [methanotrophic bacterial endosymbiont of Bathymodiolus sp.]|nr:N-ethylammeline chlorohydrolase [methanotrophic bacterial endosymbiont of Bathymodiolus sp.]